VALQVSEACRAHRELLGGELAPDDRRDLEALLDGQASPSRLADSLRLLSRLLAAHHGERVVVLLDEYDTPIHAGFASGYYDEAVGFFRNFLSAAFKDNPHLFKGVLTGILHISKENLFSGVNNLHVFGLADEPFCGDFGFTEPEVEQLAAAAGVEHQLDVIREWYDGYRFGSATIYNPWSVLQFLADPRHEPRAHWVLTSSHEVLQEVLVRGGLDHPHDLETLLGGGSVRRVLHDSLVLRDVHERPDAVWTLLYHSGYLTGTDAAPALGGRELTLRIPNREVFDSYHVALRDWLVRAVGPGGGRHLVEALLSGDADEVATIVSELLLEVLSFHDVGPRATERVYHAFLAGLLVAATATHEVRSNRESGHGRYDVALLPRAAGPAGQPGAVMELKVLGRDTVPHALAQASEQLVRRRYAAELRARGASPVYGYAVVFDGKTAHVRAVEV
jgi:hypothetical protein